MRIVGRGWLLAAVGAVVAEALTLVLILTSSHETQKELNAALILLVSGSFMISGLVGWRRQPENRMGPLLYVAGMSWCLNSLWEANDRWIYTLGAAVLGSLPIAIFIHLLVVYPTGRLEGRLARVVVFSVYPLALLGEPPAGALRPRYRQRQLLELPVERRPRERPPEACARVRDRRERPGRGAGARRRLPARAALARGDEARPARAHARLPRRDRERRVPRDRFRAPARRRRARGRGDPRRDPRVRLGTRPLPRRHPADAPLADGRREDAAGDARVTDAGAGAGGASQRAPRPDAPAAALGAGAGWLCGRPGPAGRAAGGRRAPRARGRAARGRRPRPGAAIRAPTGGRRALRRAPRDGEGPQRRGAARQRAPQPRAARRDPRLHVPDLPRRHLPRPPHTRPLGAEPRGADRPPDPRLPSRGCRREAHAGDRARYRERQDRVVRECGRGGRQAPPLRGARRPLGARRGRR